MLEVCIMFASECALWNSGYQVVILPLLEACLKLFIYNTVMHLLHILLSLWHLIVLFFWRKKSGSEVLIVQKVGASSVWSSLFTIGQPQLCEQKHCYDRSTISN
jgi:hypothetical protein